MRSRAGRSLSLLLALVAVGCRREEVRVYEAPRDAQPAPATASAPASAPAPAPAPAGGNATAPRSSPVPWVVPAGWEERPNSSGMRVASYGVRLPDGRDMDVSVVALGEQAGSLLDNVNRWRRELALPEVAEDALATLRTAVRIGRQESFLYDLVSDGPPPGSNAPVRTLAAVLPAGGMTVFFKARGDAELVAAQRSNVVAWLGSVMTGPAGPDSAPPAAGESDAEGLPAWTVPAHWRDAGPRPMRAASFSIPATAGTPGDVSVSFLGGDGGGLLANINRWRGQVGLAPLDEAGLRQSSVELKLVGGRTAVLVDLPGSAQRILAAVVELGERTWFFKLTGSPELVEAERGAFRGFVESVRF